MKVNVVDNPKHLIPHTDLMVAEHSDPLALRLGLLSLSQGPLSLLLGEVSGGLTRASAGCNLNITVEKLHLSLCTYL